MKIKKGDTVKVIAGPKGKKGFTGKVLMIDRAAERVIIEGLPMLKRHLKPERSRKHPEGGLIEKPSSVHVSNVMLVSESLGKPVKVGYKIENDKKVRVARGKELAGQVI